MTRAYKKTGCKVTVGIKGTKTYIDRCVYLADGKEYIKVNGSFVELHYYEHYARKDYYVLRWEA